MLAILGVASSAVAFYSLRMNAQQKFYTSAARLVQNIQAAEELMVIHSQDIVLQFKQLKKGVQIELLFDEELPPGFRQVFAKAKDLEGIESIAWLGEDGRKSAPFTLRFSAKDFSVPKGVLLLHSKGEDRYILLRGYPSPVRLEAAMPRQTQQIPQYPHEVRSL